MRAWGMVAGLLLAAILAAPASAHVHAVIPANHEGPNETFATNENIWATGTANPLEGFNQLCVVEESGPAEDCERDGIWGQPNVIAVTGTYLQPIVPAGPLPTGTYRILGDNGDDGDDVVSVPFYVVPCTEDDCSTHLAQAQLEQWKAAAAQAITGPKVACLAMMVHTQDAKELAVSALTEGGRSFIVGQLIDTTALELDFNVPQSTQDLAKGLLRHVACGAYLAYGDIIADPPDPDFEHVTQPQPETLPTVGMTAADDAATALEQFRANAVAQRIAAERYQGAVEEDDDGWSAFHATTMAETGFAFGRQARRAVGPLRSAALELDGDVSIQPSTEASLQRARDVRERIAEEGFTAGERADLEALGVAPAEMVALRAEMGSPLPSGAAGVHPADALRAEADALEDTSCFADGASCAFDEFARLAGAVGGNTAVPPRVEVSDVTLAEGDRGRNHVNVPLRLSHPAMQAVTGSLTGDLPESVTAAPNRQFSFAPRTLRAVRSFEIENDDDAGSDRTAELGIDAGATALGGAPFTLTVTEDDDAPSPRPGRHGRLALSSGSGTPRVFIAEPAGTDVEQIYESEGEDRLHPEDWSADGRHLLMHRVTLTASDDEAGGRPYYALPVGADGRPAGAKVRLTPPGNGLYEGASWSHDGNWLAYIDYRGFTWGLSLRRIGADAQPEGNPSDLTQDPDLAAFAWFDGASWSPDGSRLAFAGCESGYDHCGVYVVDVADGVVTGPPRVVARMRYDLGEDADLPSWSPDGRFLAYRTRDADMTETVVRVRVNAAGAPQGPPVILSTLRIETAIRWAPDTRAVTFASTENVLSDAAVRSGVVVDLDDGGIPTGAPRSVTPLALGAVMTAWGPPVPDDADPVTTASLDTPANAQGWHNRSVGVRLRADDGNGDGVASVRYTVDGGAPTTVTGATATVPVSTDGVHTISYFARDTAGNAEAAKSLVVRVDRTAPSVAVASPGAGVAHPVGASVAAGYACADGGSGVTACEGSTPAGAALDTTIPGGRVLRVVARDRAGNATTAERSWSVFAPAVAAPPAQRPAPASTPKPATAPPAANLPSARRCVSRRRFRITLAKPSGDPLRSAEVFIDSRRVRRITGRKLTAPIDLRGLPKGKFRVRVVAKTRSGRSLSIKRTYRTCVAKRRRAG